MNDKPQMSVFVRVLLVLLILTILLIAMVAHKQRILTSDTIVILQTKPIDPRSLFRGDYVRLKYNINELILDKLSGDKVFHVNDNIYVILQLSGRFWEAISIHKNRADISEKLKNTVLIQGVVKRVKHHLSAVTLEVTYGIENYFVPEGEGLKLERPKPGDEVTLEIALAEDGQAVIKALLLNGVRQYEETLF